MTAGTWRVTWVPRAQKAFDALPAREKPRILEALRELSLDPLRGPSIKKLEGRRQGYYRYRQGDYRILFEVLTEAHKVRVIGIVQRGGAYK